MSNTSPGPWHVVVANDGDTYVCGNTPLADGLNPIAAVDSEPEYVDDDARLLAAAPTLLETLRELVEAEQFEGLGYGDRRPGGPNEQRWRAASAAAEALIADLDS